MSLPSFLGYELNEAAFNSGNIERVVTLITKNLSRKLGKLYRWGGPKGRQTLYSTGYGDTIGFLFFMDNNGAFRLNFSPKMSKKHKSMSISSIDIWKKYKSDDDPDFHATFSPGLNIIMVLDQIAKLIKSPRSGKIKAEYDNGSKSKVRFESFDQFESLYLTEAPKTTVADFTAAAQQIHGKLVLSRAEIKQVATSINRSIPPKIWDMKAGRGKWDLSMDVDSSSGSGSSSTQSDSKPEEYIIMGRGELGRFFNKGVAKEVKNLDKEISKLQNSTKLTPEQIEKMYGEMTDLVDLVVQGKRPSLLITGGAGTGKTFSVMQAIKKGGLQEQKDYVVVKGKASPLGMYSTLILNRDKLVVFDDSDSVFDTQDSRNILKAALDSYGDRQVSWNSPRQANMNKKSKEEIEDYIKTIEDELEEDPSANVKLPSTFFFRGRIIFISNIPHTKMEKAILSRSLVIDMTLKEEEILDRIELILEHVGNKELSVEGKKEILNVLRGKLKNRELSSEITMRTFVAAVDIKLSGKSNWSELLKYV